MHISQFIALLQKKTEGQITPEEEVLLEDYYARLLEEEFQEAGQVIDPEERGAKERMRAAIHAKIKERKKRPLRFALPRKWQSAAAVFMLAIAGSGLIYVAVKRPGGNTGTTNFIEVASASAARKIVLPDSSVVVLQAGSRLRYPARFAAKERRVFLEGEAYYGVVHDGSQPFVVECGQLQVKDIGTSFVVDALSHKSMTKVTVLTGEVNVRERGTDLGPLHPNQELTVDSASGSAIIGNVNAANEAAWIHPEIHFSGTALGDVFKALGKEYGVTITGGNSVLLHSPFSGSFPPGTGIDSIMGTLSAIFNFSYQYNHEKMTVLIQP